MPIGGRAGTAGRSVSSMARLRPILTRFSAAPAGLFCLLAGLVLTSSLPAPAVLRAALGNAMRVPSEGQDSLPDDTELPEGENPSGEFGLQTTAQRRSQRLSSPHGLRASRLLWPWTVFRPLSA